MVRMLKYLTTSIISLFSAWIRYHITHKQINFILINAPNGKESYGAPPQIESFWNMILKHVSDLARFAGLGKPIQKDHS